jgi:hypothetical protein
MEALALLEHYRAHLDRSANIAITITYLAQSLAALHQAGRSEQACGIAARLFALTEPEGHLRVYLDEGEPMREALLTLLTSHSQQHELAPSTTAYLSKLLAAFEHEKQGENTSLEAATTPEPSLVQPSSSAASALIPSLTRREQEVLRLLAAGASNRDIARTLVIELPTRQKTRQRPARQVGSHPSYPGDCSGACPLTALSRFLPIGGLSLHTTTPFGILLTIVGSLASYYAFSSISSSQAQKTSVSRLECFSTRRRYRHDTL